MDTNSTWNMEQGGIMDKLDISFTVILIIAGIITCPPACFVYWRIMTLASFKKQYLMKLFVVNGASNLLIYFVNILFVQFSNWPSTNGVFSWLKDTEWLPVVFQFLKEFSNSVMWQTTLFISLNRVLSLQNQDLLSKFDSQFLVFASLSSLSMSAVLCSPLLFSRTNYIPFPAGEGKIGYIPLVPNENKWTTVPALVHQYSLAVGTLLLNLVICVIIMRMRREYEIKMKSRPEQGLLLSSFISLLMHVAAELFSVLCRYVLKDPMWSYFITPTVAVSTTLPFWTMMAFAHSVRRTVLAGTMFDFTRSIIIGNPGEAGRISATSSNY